MSRCTTALQFEWIFVRTVALDVHMDDINGAATPSGLKKSSTSREVTDARPESHTNISKDYYYR